MTFEEWKRELDFPNNQYELFSDVAIEKLWKMSKGRNKKSVEWVKRNVEELVTLPPWFQEGKQKVVKLENGFYLHFKS